MQNALDGKAIKSGFIHVPLLSEMSEDFPNLFTMNKEQMILATKAMIATLVARP
jgi:pyrrolidone-carboxylate peptidase